jgi:putative spermidine/putrescine transport system permease protein
MICVLMPFWTSLLVRIVAWMIMLQQNGVVNDTLVAAGILSDENRLAMMYNFNGTVIVMTQILLPFMILPIFSVMKTIPPSYMKAAQNLGATPTLAFIRVYMPQTIPGIGAGCILVFIVAIGYYITPELVGGKDGRLIGNMVAYHMHRNPDFLLDLRQDYRHRQHEDGLETWLYQSMQQRGNASGITFTWRSAFSCCSSWSRRWLLSSRCRLPLPRS